MRLPGVNLGTLDAVSGGNTGGRVGGGVAVLVEDRYRAQAQPAGLIRALGQRRVEMTVVDPEAVVHDLGRSTDREPPQWLIDMAVVVARGRSVELLTALAIAERFGVPTINRSDSVRAVLDKAAMAAALVAAGLPTPRTWVGPPGQLARSIGSEQFPVVVKPVFGDNGRAVHLVTRPVDLELLPWSEPIALAQSYIAGADFELKLYVAGQNVWAVRARPRFQERNGDMSDEPVAVSVTSELEQLAKACGAVFELDLFGVDCALGPGGPVVLEVNDFPNYRGVAEADEVLADLTLAARGAAPLKLAAGP